jgi:hypothetical protein
MSRTVTLTKPIQAHGATLTQLTLREPKGRDIASCGLPRVISQRGKALSMDVDTEAIHAYISVLGNIPPSSVDQIDAFDWMEVQKVVLDFFEQRPKGSEDDSPSGTRTSTTSPPAPATIPIPFQDPTT